MARGTHPNSLANLQSGRIKFDEKKKVHTVSVTPKSWEGISQIAAASGCSSISEFLELLGRGEVNIAWAGNFTDRDRLEGGQARFKHKSDRPAQPQNQQKVKKVVVGFFILCFACSLYKYIELKLAFDFCRTTRLGDD